jgi:hypothetical protein
MTRAPSCLSRYRLTMGGIGTFSPARDYSLADVPKGFSLPLHQPLHYVGSE